MKSDTVRMIVGFGLVVVILIGWQLLYKPRPRQQTPVVAAETNGAEEKSDEGTERPREQVAANTPPVAVLKPILTPDQVVPETTVVLENDVLRLEFTNIGGALTSCWLKTYKTELVPKDQALLGTDVLLEGGVASLAAVAMGVDGARSEDGDAAAPRVRFTARAESLTVTKTYVLGQGYDVACDVRVEGAAQGVSIDARAGIAFTEQNLREAVAHYHFYARSGKKLTQIHAGKLKTARAEAERPDWVGAKSKYFVLAFISPEGTFDSTWSVASEDGRIGFSAVRRGNASAFTAYLGPIDYDRLRRYGIGLENVAGLGWTKPVALAMLWFLRLLYSIVRNWGVAIIVFSVLMKAVFYPLTRVQTRQMRQMQLLQPKLNELKAKYKDDAQRLNQETMQLYKLYKINPMSGCLPLLVQMPIFWALYAVLRNSIELRGAGLGLWLKDLSEPDVLLGHLPAGIPMIGGSGVGLLPVLMGVSFIAQNLITSTDKKNWALTIIFPIFITLIFLNMPSGLQLYWFVYNVLSIGESMIALKGSSLWHRTKAPAIP